MRLRTRLALIVSLALTLGACATTPKASASGPIAVVAAENFWGSLAAQLGGAHVQVTNIINNPDADPHDYEPTGPDARHMANARLAIINGVGYDHWATQLVAANDNSDTTVLTVGDLVGVAPGGNPHRWYSPADVRAVIDQITADYTKIDPADAAFFATQHDTVVNTGLKRYFDAIAQIKRRFAGTPVGASESIFAPLAEATGLNLITPASFLIAISDGTDPTAADKTAIDAQIAGKQIKVYVYNRQNATPDIAAQVNAAKAQGIPVSTITETLTPAGASFQDWQVAQLDALSQALATATGK
jgi:zinc/manganese transport system substrate-binding protein